MISFKGRESKRGRLYKMSRNLERLYKEGKCRECKVLVTRMDFAKILGKFTKVKIQYESSSSPKGKNSIDSSLSNANSRLKCNENGMVLIKKNYSKKKQSKGLETTLNETIKSVDESIFLSPPNKTPTSNILKENNGVKKKCVGKEKASNYIKNTVNSDFKQYGIVFTMPAIPNNNNDIKSKLTLVDLLPTLNKSILPSDEWYIDYFPKNEEPKDDKVYDRIAAELEDLMYNEKSIEKLKSAPEPEIKVEEFPSIMDILNDTTENDLKENEQSSSESFKTNLESSDVEAMLLGKTNIENKDSEDAQMEVDSADVSKLIEDMDQLNNIADSSKPKEIIEDNEAEEKSEVTNTAETKENTHRPSMLDEALQKGIEEHLPHDIEQMEASTEKNLITESTDNENIDNTNNSDPTTINLDMNKNEDIAMTKTDEENDNTSVSVSSAEITHVVFKKILNGKCCKSVSCPKNLKYSIELEGKSVEFIGAPKYISSIEDLQVLLQIVNETAHQPPLFNPKPQKLLEYKYLDGRSLKNQQIYKYIKKNYKSNDSQAPDTTKL